MGLLTALFGLLASLMPPVAGLEEDTGLAWLFAMRGNRPVPPDVAVVAIDRASSDALGLPNKPSKWPRSLHAGLVRELKSLGARAVIFDMHFEESRNPAQDAEFAWACREAGNVVLFEYLRQEDVPHSAGRLQVEALVPPIPVLAQAVEALAPFPLPKVPVRVSEFWLFKTGAGDVPTMPVVALQVHARPYRPELLRALHEAAARKSVPLPPMLFSPGLDSGALARELRQLFQENPGLVLELLSMLGDPAKSMDARARAINKPLVGALSGADRHYLDFYGPPRSIETIAYHKVLSGSPDLPSLEGKTVFVGFSEQLQPEQKDGFYTVFSQPDGLDMSGVEIAATAFANLLEDRSVTPLAPAGQVAVFVVWGFALGMLLLLPPVWMAPTAILATLAYLGVAYGGFSTHGAWPPLMVPLLMQLPVALLAALIWRYLEVRRERQRIRAAFERYLPVPVVEKLSRNTADVSEGGEVVQGICLATDAEHYSGLAEKLEPETLHDLLNRYYATLFEPVRRRGGLISDVVGDAMLAIWAARTHRSAPRFEACQAALEILDAVAALDQSAHQAGLPTRLGLHCGRILLGNVGAGDHYEYRAVGDIVNAATRIEGLNKRLGTRALASREVVEGLEGIVTRELGSFRLAGKTKPLVIHELVGAAGRVDANAARRCERFEAGLGAFRRRSWKDAVDAFRALLAEYGEDGPARYYLQLVEQYLHDPPPDSWDGVIVIEQK